MGTKGAARTLAVLSATTILAAAMAAAALAGEAAAAAPGDGRMLGTEEAPEIVDPRGDVSGATLPGPAGAVDPLPEILDILAVWFHDPTPTTLSVSLRLADLEDQPLVTMQPGYGAHFNVGFLTDENPDGFTAYAGSGGATYHPDEPLGSWRFLFREGDGPDGTVEIAGVVDVPNDTITLTFPRDAITSATLRNITATTHGYHASPAMIQDWGTARENTTYILAPGTPLDASEAGAEADAAPTEGASRPGQASVPGMSGWTAAFGLALVASAMAVWHHQGPRTRRP